MGIWWLRPARSSTTQRRTCAKTGFFLQRKKSEQTCCIFALSIIIVVVNFFFTTGIIVFVLNTLSEIRDLSQLSRIIANRSDEGLMLETSAFKLFAVANLHFQLS